MAFLEAFIVCTTDISSLSNPPGPSLEDKRQKENLEDSMLCCSSCQLAVCFLFFTFQSLLMFEFYIQCPGFLDVLIKRNKDKYVYSLVPEAEVMHNKLNFQNLNFH